jgi:hypothetical protein
LESEGREKFLFLIVRFRGLHTFLKRINETNQKSENTITIINNKTLQNRLNQRGSGKEKNKPKIVTASGIESKKNHENIF